MNTAGKGEEKDILLEIKKEVLLVKGKASLFSRSINKRQLLL
jgi:hypothetical protein